MQTKSTQAIPIAVGIIPARYHSSRFPGKPLADILGKPMIWHVHQRASRCPHLQAVFLATDDKRIEQAAVNLNIPVIMTRADHKSGTDRVLEAAHKLGLSSETVVINIQGDEPCLEPAMISALIGPFVNPEVQVTTLRCRMTADEAQSPDRVKVVFGHDGRALYFSRAPIPFVRGEAAAGEADYWLHIGVYAFRMRTLERFTSLSPGVLAKRENLEQLRLLENNIPIHVVETSHISHGVDRPEDLRAALDYLKRNS